jgi:hypothetical protein
MSNKNVNAARALLQSQPVNTRSWANMANEEDALRPPAPPSAPATYKSKTYLPNASKWAQRQDTIAEEASAERAQTPTPLRNSNIEDIERNKRSYNRYLEREGLPRRANRTPSRERRRRSYSRRRRSPSPRHGRSHRSPSPTRRYGVGRRYVAAPGFGTRRRSPSPRRRRSHSRRRSPSPRRSYSRRRGSRNVSPLRYTIAPDGRTVNEFGRNIPQRQPPRYKPRTTRWNV